MEQGAHKKKRQAEGTIRAQGFTLLEIILVFF